MDPKAFQLSLEQQFELSRMQQNAQGLSEEQARDLLLDVTRMLMIKDNLIKDMLRRVA
jgi:hypothetical protein